LNCIDPIIKKNRESADNILEGYGTEKMGLFDPNKPLDVKATTPELLQGEFLDILGAGFCDPDKPLDEAVAAAREVSRRSRSWTFYL
jgi:hypothetical protein